MSEVRSKKPEKNRKILDFIDQLYQSIYTINKQL